MNYQTVSRLIFLLFVILASVYFMMVNKRPQRSVERFEEEQTSGAPSTAPAPSPKVAPVPSQYDPDSIIESKDTQVNMDIIRDLFDANFGRQPSRKEVEFYIDYISTRKIKISELNAIIAGDNNVLKSTFEQNSSVGYQYKASEPVLGTEDDVIEAFNEILYRNPDYAELRYYARKLKNDKDFSLEKLKQLLISSAEYKRLEKTQTNNAYSDTLGNVTDRQITFVITTIYKEEAKEDIDEDTLKFLKKRYLEFQLNDDTLRKFIKQYITFQKDFEKDIRNAAATGVSKGIEPFGSSLSQNIYTKNGSTKSDATDGSATDDASTTDGAKDGSTNTGSTTGSTTDSTKESGKEGAADDMDKRPNKELLKKIESLYQSDDSEYLDSSKVIKTLLQGNEECNNVDKDALEKRLEAMDKQMLAKLIYDRNMDHMKNVCRRNQKYMNADENMVLFPEFRWSVPQKFPPVCTPLEKNEYQPLIDQTSLIGTLISDADRTKVGSILPKNPPY